MTKKEFICNGTSMDGLEMGFDLIKWSGYRDITEEEWDKIRDKKYEIFFLIHLFTLKEKKVKMFH